MSDDVNRDAADILRGIEQDQRTLRRAMGPDLRLVCTTWGAAWVIAFLALWFAVAPAAFLPLAAAIIVALGALVIAIVVSAVHSARRASGSRGPSALQGALYGNAQFVAFLIVGLLGWRLMADGLPAQVALSYWVAAPAMVVGVMSVVGSVLFDDRFMLVFGGWVVVVALLSLAFPAPFNLLVGVLGGAGFFAFAVLAAVRPTLLAGGLTRHTDG